jgi:hypothetical protein
LQRDLLFPIVFGFVVACIGMLARIYMDFSVKDGDILSRPTGRNTEMEYERLMKEQGAPSWPLYVALTCIPLGIAIVFGAILWRNHLKLRRLSGAREISDFCSQESSVTPARHMRLSIMKIIVSIKQAPEPAGNSTGSPHCI